MVYIRNLILARHASEFRDTDLCLSNHYKGLSVCFKVPVPQTFFLSSVLSAINLLDCLVNKALTDS